MQGKNTIVITGDYSIGLLSQTSGNLNTDTIIRVNSDGSVTPSFSDGDDTFIVTAGNHAVGVLACASPGSARGFAPIFPDICYHLTHYKPAAADIPV
ncbi:hypothetical protein ACNISL_20395, partial [Escherichia coli]